MENKVSKVALRTSLIYAGVAAVWILLSGRILVAFVSDPATRNHLEIYKGWAFVAVTALLLYTLLRGQLRRVEREVVERKQVEQALRESEAKFRSYVENAAMAVLVADPEHRFVHCNPAAIQLLGYDLTTLRGMHTMDLHFEEDREVAIQAHATFVKEGHSEHEFRLRRRDGNGVWVSLRAVRLEDGGSLAYCQDITRRKEAEESIARERQLLRTLIDMLPETFYVKDLDSRFLVANTALAKHFGKETPSQVLGLTDADFFRPSWAPGIAPRN